MGFVPRRLSVKHHTTGASVGNKWQFTCVYSMRAADEEEAYMPVLLLWAVPTVIVVGGLGYYFLRVVQ
jgi:hypothetical protein